MTKPLKPDTPHRIELQFRKRHRADPARELVLVMQRFAARVCQIFPQAVVKGGLGLELRLDTPRTTKDADIMVPGMPYPAKRYLIQAFFTDADPRSLADKHVYRKFRLEVSIREAADFRYAGEPMGGISSSSCRLHSRVFGALANR